MGSLATTCTKINLNAPVETIRASYSEETGSVNAIQYRRDDKMRTFGVLNSQYEEWNFNSSSKLIGMYGSVDEKSITKLGFITLEDDEDKCLPDPPRNP